MHGLSWMTIFWSRVMWFAKDFHEWRSHEWKSLANHLTSDQKVVIHGNECIILFLTRYFMPWAHNSATNKHWSLISPLPLTTVFSDLTLWRHHSWSVTSREREALALWRHLHRLFLHAQIGAKAVFTSEKQAWISISHHPIFTDYRVKIIYYPTPGCDIQGFRAMGLNVQYWPRWIQDFRRSDWLYHSEQMGLIWGSVPCQEKNRLCVWYKLFLSEIKFSQRRTRPVKSLWWQIVHMQKSTNEWKNLTIFEIMGLAGTQW